MRDDLKLCLSMYACEPHRGSEPGVGWAWALGMAKRHETWEITRANNRKAIEEELDRLSVPADDRPHFVWVDLPSWVLRLKKRGAVPVGLYYFLWQFAARRAWDRTGIRADVIHHVTFNTFSVPGVWWKRREKVVLGPLGGMSVCERQYLRCFHGARRLAEAARGATRRFWFLDPFFVVSRKIAAVTIYTTEEMRRRMRGKPERSFTMIEAGVPSLLESRVPEVRISESRIRFVWAGTLAGHKGGELAIRSFVRAFGPDCREELCIFGKGPDKNSLEKLVASLGAGKSVKFQGTVSQTELWDATARATAMFFTSVRDTSGNVVLEAMACGTPVVCLRHQGVAELVDSSCAVAVEPAGWEETIDSFADALKLLAGNPELVVRLGAAGRRRALEKFSWKSKFDIADEIYLKMLSAPQ